MSKRLMNDGLFSVIVGLGPFFLISTTNPIFLFAYITSYVVGIRVDRSFMSTLPALLIIEILLPMLIFWGCKAARRKSAYVKLFDYLFLALGASPLLLLAYILYMATTDGPGEPLGLFIFINFSVVACIVGIVWSMIIRNRLKQLQQVGQP